MRIEEDVKLADFTSFGTGGSAQILAFASTTEDVQTVISEQPPPFWLLGRGANVLISDEGLPGTTLRMQLETITFEDAVLVVESGASWDAVVQASIARGLWGIELTSGIPGTVGAAVVGNIAAYGQAVSDTLLWIDVIDHAQADAQIQRLPANELELGYRSSRFSKNPSSSLIILRAAFGLSKTQTTHLEYETALKVARENKLNPESLDQRREVIMKTREQAGSLLDKDHRQKTAGSFFKNPLVSQEVASELMKYEEFGNAEHAIKKQNQIHGGDELRVSASHVLLAAGFKRGQAWGPVRIHPEHILKIENTGGATSQQIYDVAQEIMQTVRTKLGVTLVPEVRFLGDFN